jgi:hypothetical protein
MGDDTEGEGEKQFEDLKIWRFEDANWLIIQLANEEIIPPTEG